MRETTRINKEIFLRELSRNGGHVEPTCAVTARSKTQHYQWMKDDPEYKEKVLAILRGVEGFTKSKLYLRALEGKAKSIRRMYRESIKKLAKHTSQQ